MAEGLSFFWDVHAMFLRFSVILFVAPRPAVVMPTAWMAAMYAQQ